MSLSSGCFAQVLRRGFLVSGLSLVLYCGCGGENAPVTAEKSKFQVAGEEQQRPAVGGDSQPASGDAEESGLSKLRRNKANQRAGIEEPSTTTDEPQTKGAEDTTDYGASPQYPLPDGGAQALMNFIQDLSEKQPMGRTQKDQETDYLAIQDSRLAAGRKLLTHQLQPQVKFGILQMMLEIHQAFIEGKVPGAEQRLESFAKELRDSKDSEVAELGRVQEFEIAVNKVAKQDPPPADGKEVVQLIQKFVSDAKGSPVAFIVAGRKCIELQNLEGATPEFQRDLIDELKRVAGTYKENPNPQIASQAAGVIEMAAALEADIEIKPKLKDVAEGKEGAEESFLEAVKEVLAKAPPSGQLFAKVQEKADELEYMHSKYQTAIKVYDLLEPVFKEHENKELAKAAGDAIEDARKRLSLIGKPLVVEGVTPDGKPFDLEPYKGKVVLVDFWATWCRPCLEELPNVKRNYEAYHSKGFDVIGVSLDSELETLKRFLSLQGPPWQTIISQELFEKKMVEDGFGSNSSAAACGVKAIPFVVLIGQDGNVDSIHVRGPKLAERLKELLGEPAEKPAAKEANEPAEEKPAEEKPPEKSAKDKPGAKQPAADKSEENPADEPKKEAKEGDCGEAPQAEEPERNEAAEAESKINPYSAKPGLSADKLVVYIEKMLDKPKSIQVRPGFADAVVEACDRVLSANPAAKETEFFIAAEAKFETLHKKARAGDEACDKALMAFVQQMKADARPRIAGPVAFFQQERKVLDGAELPVEKVPDLLKELRDYYAAEKLTAKHLRMASSTVALINKLENGDEREKQFAEFGGLFAKASDKELARYGKKLAQKPEAEESDLVGKELELAGTTAAGKEFNWAQYRGKVVLVDFWATWCGPCRREMPHVKELHEKLQAKGFAVVGISLDKDQDALSAYLAENEIPWETLAGDETQELAEKYGVRGIPTMMVVGKDGKILGVSHDVSSLNTIIEKALAGK